MKYFILDLSDPTFLYVYWEMHNDKAETIFFETEKSAHNWAKKNLSPKYYEVCSIVADHLPPNSL